MKINIFDWAGSVRAEGLAPYSHNEIIEGDRSTIHKIVDHYLDKKLSVMIKQHDSELAVIYVDTKTFQQR
jgi:hypothetical protein